MLDYCYEMFQFYVGQEEVEGIICFCVVLIYQIMFYMFKDFEYGVNLFVFKEFGNIYFCIMNFMVDVLEKCIVVFEGGVVVVVVVFGQAV